MTESDYKERAFDEEYKRMVDKVDYAEYKLESINDSMKRKDIHKKRKIERKNRKSNRKNRTRQ